MEFPLLVLLLGICYFCSTSAAPPESGGKRSGNRLELCEIHGTVDSLSKLGVNDTLDEDCTEVFRIYRGRKMIDLSGRGLKKFNSNWFKLLNAKTIDLSNNLIADLTPELLNDLPIPLTIDLRNNHITIIRKNRIENDNCIGLNLKENPIQVIESDAFKNLCLTQLIISQSALKNLDFIRTLPVMISYLTVRGNTMVTEIPTGLFQNFHKLLRIDFSYNQIRKIRENTFSGLGNSEKLLSVYLNQNKIDSIEAGSFSHTSLRRLDLSSNNITDTSIWRGAFNDSSIELIILSGNPIEWIPEFSDMVDDGYIDM